MKATLLLVSLLALSTVSPAQLVQPDTPKPLTVYELKVTTDGSTIMALNAWTFAERYYALPFGMEFNAGHGVWLGTRTSIKSPGDAQGVLGYEIYGLKPVGGDQFFLKVALGACLGPRTESQKALSGFLSVSAVKKF